MAIQINALEARIVQILKDWYPITFEELRDELSLRKETLERTLKSLVVKGVIVLEPLSDKTYIRLLNPEVDVSVDRKKKPKKREPPAVPPLDDDSIMYR